MRGGFKLWMTGLVLVLGVVLTSAQVAAAQDATDAEAAPADGSAGVVEAPVLAEEATPASPSEPALGQAAPTEGGNQVRVHRDDAGWKLQVDGEDFMVFGMNWGYIPRGENYSYSLWKKSDAFIEEVLEEDMGLLKAMGVNAIRQFDDIPPRWVAYIYEKYGIFTVVNHLMGRYGFSIDGNWVPNINYESDAMTSVIIADLEASVARYKDTPGVLLWLLGNENNYGLHWSSFEIEALPADEQHQARAAHLYTYYGRAIAAIKALDTSHPVAIANGDLQYIDLIAEHCTDLDILGSNVYRGISSRDLFDEVRDKLGVPFMYTEFGADAYDAKRGEENHLVQARYLVGQWREIYEQSHGKGRVGNAIGGIIFQWSDGWWKYKQTENLDVHDETASWPNGGYWEDYVEGQNNMNEEWWGITAKGPNDEKGMFRSYPRSAYYALQKAFELDPYAPGTSVEKIGRHFGALQPKEFATAYELVRLDSRLRALEMVRNVGLRMNFEVTTTGGEDVEGEHGKAATFDHMESFYLDVGLNPFRRLDARLSLNVLGHVSSNRIDDIYYEKRGLPVRLMGANGAPVTLNGLERLRVYQAEFTWEEPWFSLSGYYRTGHFHWGYEGDFFGLYREAFYGPNLDIYNGNAPFGFVFEGKGPLEGLKVAAGPELYWGANPSVILKYHRKLGRYAFSLMHQEDISRQSELTTSFSVPEPLTRKTSLYFGMDWGSFKLEMGGLFAGSDKVGQPFLAAREAGGPTYKDSGYHILEDEIQWQDTLGAKLRLEMLLGPVQWYVQGAYKGLVADSGVDARQRPTGWRLGEDGRGNHYHVLTGLTFSVGNLQIGPNFLYQKPLEGPLPSIEDYYSMQTGKYYPGIAPRNVLDDPFAVLGNRETIGFEICLVWDPTPGSWMWMWDNDLREDADFAMSLDFFYRMHPTPRDSTFAFSEQGFIYAFGASPPAVDEWGLHARIVSHPMPAFRLVAHLYAEQGTANGPFERVITRGGGDVRMTYDQLDISAFLKFNDFGPYDYHRDFALTFPVQLITDVSWALKLPDWIGGLVSKFGVRYQMRWLDEHSPGFGSVGVADAPWGHEWELRTYLQLSL